MNGLPEGAVNLNGDPVTDADVVARYLDPSTGQYIYFTRSSSGRVDAEGNIVYGWERAGTLPTEPASAGGGGGGSATSHIRVQTEGDYDVGIDIRTGKELWRRKKAGGGSTKRTVLSPELATALGRSTAEAGPATQQGGLGGEQQTRDFVQLGGGQVPVLGEEDVQFALDTAGIQVGEPLATLPDRFIQGPGTPEGDMPLTAGGVVPGGLTFVPGTQDAPQPQLGGEFTNAAGLSTGIGVGFNPQSILEAHGFNPAGGPKDFGAVLQLMNEIAKIQEAFEAMGFIAPSSSSLTGLQGLGRSSVSELSGMLDEPFRKGQGFVDTGIDLERAYYQGTPGFAEGGTAFIDEPSTLYGDISRRPKLRVSERGPEFINVAPYEGMNFEQRRMAQDRRGSGTGSGTSGSSRIAQTRDNPNLLDYQKRARIQEIQQRRQQFRETREAQLDSERARRAAGEAFSGIGSEYAGQRWLAPWQIQQILNRRPGQGGFEPGTFIRLPGGGIGWQPSPEPLPSAQQLPFTQGYPGIEDEIQRLIRSMIGAA